jgi:hypothetical protein
MSLIVKVCGCRPLEGRHRASAAGVRKPPKEETALGGRRTGRLGRHQPRFVPIECGGVLSGIVTLLRGMKLFNEALVSVPKRRWL